MTVGGRRGGCAPACCSGAPHRGRRMSIELARLDSSAVPCRSSSSVERDGFSAADLDPATAERLEAALPSHDRVAGRRARDHRRRREPVATPHSASGPTASTASMSSRSVSPRGDAPAAWDGLEQPRSQRARRRGAADPRVPRAAGGRRSTAVPAVPGCVRSRSDGLGCYVPGGRAAYPSTVLMSVIPAQVAGVERIVVASPPAPTGGVHPLVAAAAHLLGVREVIIAGGAQAIAALAFGTESIDRVDKIVGPGNAFVDPCEARGVRRRGHRSARRTERDRRDRHRRRRRGDGRRRPRVAARA